MIVAVTGCGGSSASSSSTASSSPSTTTSTASTAAAVKADPKPILAVASPAGAVPASKAKLTKLHVVKKAKNGAHLAGLGKLSLTQATEEVSGDLNSFWSQEFASSGVQWPQMQQVIVDSSPVQTQCSARATVAPTDPWYLCDGSASGGTFFWTIPWMQQNIATDAGGVNLAFNMAEMWSFHILNLFGFTTQMQQGAEPKAAWAEQAVCLTGVYVHSLSQRQLFEQGDQQTADNFITSLSAVAGITSPDVTSQQLQQTFVAGYNSGAPSTCQVGGGGGGGGTSTTSTAPAPSPGTSTGTGTGPTTIPLGSSNG